MKYVFLFGVFMMSFTFLKAQNRFCPTDLSKLNEAELKKVNAFYESERAPLPKSLTTDSVAITVHIVETVPGAANITYADIENEIKKVNLAYVRAGITFFICGSPRYVRGAEVYTPSTSDQLNNKQHVDNTINIFFVEDLDDPTTNRGGITLGYTFLPWTREPEDMYIMMRKSASTDGGTLTHEMGHFYGLLHTHDFRYGREFVDGSNCGSAGDRLCDTPADPNLGIPGIMSGCVYVGNFVDPKGDPYSPPASNFMSYAPSPCMRAFSEEQIALMRSVHENVNNYLANNCDFYPDFAVNTNTKQLSIRSDEDFTVEYTFQSEGVEQAYDVELNITLGEDPNNTQFILVSDRVTITPGQGTFTKTYDIDFPIARSTGTYYMNALIDSEFKIIERTEGNNNALTTIEVDNTTLSDLVLFPNPVDDELKMFFRDEKARGAMFIRVYRYDGRLVLSDEAFKGSDEFFRVLDVSWLSTGLYVIAVNFERVNTEYSFKFLKK